VIVIIGAALLLRVGTALMHGVHADRDLFAFIFQGMDLVNGNLEGWFYGRTKPPVFCAILAGPMALGVDGIAAARVISVLAGMLMLHPAWLIMRRIGGGKMLLLALATLALSRLAVKSSGRPLSDTTYSCMVLYVVYLAVIRGLVDGKWWGFVAGGLLAGLAFLTRSEGIIYLPLIPLLAFLGALARKLPWRMACVSLAFPVLAAAVMAPQIAMLSHHEGRFLVRRNVGQFMASSAGIVAEEGSSPETVGLSTFETLSRGAARVLAAWVHHVGQYFWDKTAWSMGYAGMVFLIAGAVVCRRQLFRWGPLSLTLAVFLWTVFGMSFFKPHARLLTPVIAMLSWPLAAGIIALTDWVIHVNPARLAVPEKARPWLVALMLGILAAPTVAHVLTRDYYEDRGLLAAAEIVRSDHVGQAPPAVATSFGLVPLRADGRHVELVFRWEFTLDRLGQYLRRHRTDYLVMPGSRLREMCAQFDPDNPPDYLRLVGTAASHPKSERHRVVYVYRVRPAEAAAPADEAP